MKKKIVLCALIIAGFSVYLPAEDAIDLIDTQTTETLDRGFFNVGFFLYDNGGIYARTLIGMTEQLTLGVSESVDNAIGSDAAVWHIPSVYVKVRLFHGAPDKIHLALGFAPQTYSRMGYQYDKQVQSVYLVARKGFNFFVPDVYQFLHAGVRYPVLPEEYRKKNRVNLFFGLSSRIGPDFEIKGEIENIAFHDEEKPLYNFSCAYYFSEMFSLELAFQYRFVDESFEFNRMLKLNYINIFY